jgi:hypothetical protein
MEKDIINDLKTEWNSQKYKKVQTSILDKITILNTLESSLNNCSLKKDDINLSFYKEELKKNLSFDEKVKLCQRFIQDLG